MKYIVFALCMLFANVCFANPWDSVEWQDETMIAIRGDDGTIKYMLDVGGKPMPTQDTVDYRNEAKGKIYSALVYENGKVVSVKIAYFQTMADDYAYIRYLYEDGTINYHKIEDRVEEFTLLHYLIAYSDGTIYSMQRSG